MRAEQGVDTTAFRGTQTVNRLGYSRIDVEASPVDSFQQVRRRSELLCEPLAVEDYGVQPMEDASPPKWHLAHTSWFFETFILKANVQDYQPFHPQFEYLFNSYYNGVGQPYPRPKRGLLSRPTVAEIMSYRAHVDQHMLALLEGGVDATIGSHLCLGLHHEQQHQELLLTDLKYNFGHNPLYPAYRDTLQPGQPVSELAFVEHPGGIVGIGGEQGFVFDNETPVHDVLLQPFALADRVITNAEYLAFIEDGGYQQAHLWLSEGWSTVCAHHWQAPLYWQQRNGAWFEYRLDGLQPLDPHLPVVHISGHEAFAFATWCGLRLPTEFEFETMARAHNQPGALLDDGQTSIAAANHFVENERFHPASVFDLDTQSNDDGPLRQMFGEVWQWTASSYGPYPGYKPLPGTLGEYNGKFMSSQLVLRGASCATPSGHARDTYRNFFYPGDRWQFTGIRLAKDV